MKFRPHVLAMLMLGIATTAIAQTVLLMTRQLRNCESSRAIAFETAAQPKLLAKTGCQAPNWNRPA